MRVIITSLARKDIIESSRFIALISRRIRLIGENTKKGSIDSSARERFRGREKRQTLVAEDKTELEFR